MIKLIYGHERIKIPAMMDAMHQPRKQVFHERLRLEVSIKSDWEFDRFDGEDPLYILSLDSEGELQGSLRLLPTTGPNMLGGIFGRIIAIEISAFKREQNLQLRLVDPESRSRLFAA
jgi:acyl homoserine lactone synthase